MTIKERKNQIANLTKELRTFLDKNDLENAKAKQEEIRQAKELLAIEEANVEEERADLEERAVKEVKVEKEERGVEQHMEKVSKEVEYRALWKTIFGKQLTEEESRAITDGNFNSNTGAILPEDFDKAVLQFRKGYKALKDYCDVIPVSTMMGKSPVTSLDDELADLEEDKAMKESMLKVNPLNYEVKDYGLLKKVSDNLVEDSPVNFIEGILAPSFAVASVNKENKEIVKVVESVADKVVNAPGFEVADLLEEKLFSLVPSIRQGAVILTNNRGYRYLHGLTVEDGHRDDRITMMNQTLYFDGKEVIELDETRIPALSSDNNTVFYVVNLKAFPFFDRKGYEIAKSTEAGFTSNVQLVRCIERFQVKENVTNIAEAKPVKIEAKLD